MLRRCYDQKYSQKNETYKDCKVIPDWLIFTNFKSWMETQSWVGKHLDKDLLVKDNKLYGPLTCTFVSALVNRFMTESTKSRGDYPIGVTYDKATSKFLSQCKNPLSGKNEHLGRFESSGDAHRAWLTRKLELSELLGDLEGNEVVKQALIKRYTNYTAW